MSDWDDFVDELDKMSADELAECLVILELYLSEWGMYVSDNDKQRAMQRLGLLGKEF